MLFANYHSTELREVYVKSAIQVPLQSKNTTLWFNFLMLHHSGSRPLILIIFLYVLDIIG